jgi:hypothetical protein
MHTVTGGVAIIGGLTRFPLRIASAAARGPRVIVTHPNLPWGSRRLSLKDQ